MSGLYSARLIFLILLLAVAAVLALAAARKNR
jgi:hypothetical protein